MPKTAFIGGQFYELNPDADTIKVGDWCYEPETGELFQAAEVEQVEFPHDESASTVAIIDEKGVYHYHGHDPWWIHKVLDYGKTA